MIPVFLACIHMYTIEDSEPVALVNKSGNLSGPLSNSHLANVLFIKLYKYLTQFKREYSLCGFIWCHREVWLCVIIAAMVRYVVFSKNRPQA